ncbi:MAG TPA: DUF4382 domain-containing protein [Candidatus Binataceae bacterium]|nr:DUF4382 domain-containing protein [Candidatus Binataceae bacterium]
MGALEIGFIDSPSNGFQSIALNIVSVRLNPSTNPAVPDTDPNWVTVSAPSGAGPGELSVNLLDFQNNAVVFNIGQVTAQNYNQVEVVIDATQPGMVIPSCSAAKPAAQEGCITANVAFTGSTNLRTTSPVSVPFTGLTTLLLDINPGTPVPPASPGGKYTLNPSISVAPVSPFLIPVSGTVAGVPATGDIISAELTGTNSIVASAQLTTGGNFTMQLPAAEPPGTTYDLFVSGSSTFAVKSGITLIRGGSAPPAQSFTVLTASGVALTGAVIDGRTKGALTGATVSLLLPASSADNCVTSMSGCVIVATTTSDSAGNYTFPSVTPPPSGTPFYVQASIPGTNTVTQLLSYSSIPTCPSGPNASNCSFLLDNDLLTGTITVDPPPGAGTNTVVTLLAEPTGTGNLVGFSQVTVTSLGTAPFQLEVPTTVSPTTGNNNVDLIASAQDAYLGVGTQFSGHQLAVLGNVNPTSPPAGGINLTVSCLGHGTIAGTALSPDANTHVRLFQDGVQLMDSTVGSTVPTPGSTATPAFPTQYSFCAPPNNTYTIQRFEETSATAVPVGTATMIVVPTPEPVATSSPCPLCENALGQCPGNCSATSANSLQP